MSGSDLHSARLTVAIVFAAALVAGAAWSAGVAAAGVVATLCLGAATVWLGWQSRKAIQQVADFRAQEALDRAETALRAALLEQLDECRAWVRWEPNYSDGQRAQRVLQQRLPVFDHLRDLLQRESINPDCRGRLLWRMNQLTEWVEEKSRRWALGTPDPNDVAWRNDWPIQVDRHQEIVGLLLGAAAQNGFHELVGAFRNDQWLQPSPVHGTEIERKSLDMQEVAAGRLPPWPSDTAFAPWSPAARDELAKRLQAALTERMTQSMQQGLGLPYPDGSGVSAPPKTPDL